MSQAATARVAHGNVEGNLRDQAMTYADRGWSVIPVTGKKPCGPWKAFQTRPAGPKTLSRLFRKDGITGLAVILGRASGGLGVRDFDQAHAYQAWAKQNPDDSATLPTVKTARGFHVYGRLNQETYATLPDGELRGDSRHYVLLPPSQHPDGPSYVWANPLPDDLDMPFLPQSLLHGSAGTQATQASVLEVPTKPINSLHCVPPSVLEAIDLTLPEGPGRRNRVIFNFARRLKGITGLDVSPDALKAYMIAWHQQALPHIRTKDFAVSWSDFQIAWQAVKVPHGTQIRAAHAAAIATPAEPIDGNADLGTLAVLCRNLSLSTDDRLFYLSCRTVEQLFGVGRTTAWRWLQALQFFQVIQLVTKGTLKGRKASVWRYCR